METDMNSAELFDYRDNTAGYKSLLGFISALNADPIGKVS